MTIERRIEIYEMYLCGFSYNEIAKRYKITSERVQGACELMENLTEESKDDIKNLCMRFTDSPRLVTYIVNGMRRGYENYLGKQIRILTLEDLRRERLSNIQKIHNIGPGSMKVIVKMKKALDDEHKGE
jgi:hypothetical protein